MSVTTQTPAEPVRRKPLSRADWRRLVCAQGEAEPGPYTKAWLQRQMTLPRLAGGEGE